MLSTKNNLLTALGWTPATADRGRLVAEAVVGIERLLPRKRKEKPEKAHTKKTVKRQPKKCFSPSPINYRNKY